MRLVLFIAMFSSARAWSCSPAQGGSSYKDAMSSEVGSSKDNTKDSCASKCEATSGCLSFDYTTKSEKDACRLFKTSLSRPGGGRDDRQFCIRTLGTQVRVMFVGNSFTYVNDLPGQLANIAHSLGDNVTFETSTIGGCTLYHQQEAMDSKTAKLLEEDWDFIVLQDYSLLPTVQAARTKYLHPAVKDFVKRKKSAKIVMYLTWGYHDGLTSACPSSDTKECFPLGSLEDLTSPACKSDSHYEKMIGNFPCMGYSLARGYFSAKGADGADMVAPCGLAWQVVRGVKNIDDNCKAAVDKEHGTDFNITLPFKVDGGVQESLMLYLPGPNKHPNVAGQYLNALVFYATLFGKSPVGAGDPKKTMPFKLTAEEKLSLQKAAEGVVAQCGSACGLSGGLLARSSQAQLLV